MILGVVIIKLHRIISCSDIKVKVQGKIDGNNEVLRHLGLCLCVYKKGCIILKQVMT